METKEDSIEKHDTDGLSTTKDENYTENTYIPFLPEYTEEDILRFLYEPKYIGQKCPIRPKSTSYGYSDIENMRNNILDSREDIGKMNKKSETIRNMLSYKEFKIAVKRMIDEDLKYTDYDRTLAEFFKRHDLGWFHIYLNTHAVSLFREKQASCVCM